MHCVSEQYEHLPTILYNPFYISVGVGQCEQSITCSVLQLQTRIEDSELARIAEKLSSRALRSVAMLYLGLDDDELRTMEESRFGDQAGFKRDILFNWKNRNPGPYARSVSDHFFPFDLEDIVTHYKVHWVLLTTSETKFSVSGLLCYRNTNYHGHQEHVRKISIVIYKLILAYSTLMENIIGKYQVPFDRSSQNVYCG